jgi:hypothetical protein
MTTLFTASLTLSKDTELLYELMDARDNAYRLTKLRENDCAPDGADCYTVDKQKEVYGGYLGLSGKVYLILEDRLNSKLNSDDLEQAVNAIKKVNEGLARALKKQIGAVAAVKAITTAVSVAETVITKAMPIAFGQISYEDFTLNSQVKDISHSDILPSLSILIKILSAVCTDSEMADVLRYKAKDLLSRLGYLQLFSSCRADVLLPLDYSDIVKSLLADADAYLAKLIDIHVILSHFENAVREIEYGLFVQDPTPLTEQTIHLPD